MFSLSHTITEEVQVQYNPICVGNVCCQGCTTTSRYSTVFTTALMIFKCSSLIKTRFVIKFGAIPGEMGCLCTVFTSFLKQEMFVVMVSSDTLLSISIFKVFVQLIITWIGSYCCSLDFIMQKIARYCFAMCRSMVTTVFSMFAPLCKFAFNLFHLNKIWIFFVHQFAHMGE